MRERKRLILAQALTEGSLQLGRFSVPTIAVITLHTSALAVGVLSFAIVAVQIPLSLRAGSGVDRRGSKRMMLYANVWGASGACVVAITIWTNTGSLAVLAFAAALIGATAVCFDCGCQAAIARRSPTPSVRLKLNGEIIGARSVAQSVAPVLGGAVFLAAGGGTVMAIAAAALLVSAGVTAALPAESESSELQTAASHILEALKDFRKSRVLRLLFCSNFSLNLSLGVVQATVLVFLYRRVHLSAGIVGGFLSGQGLAAVAGAVFAPRLLRKRTVLRGMPIAIAGIGSGTLLIMAASTGPPLPVLIAAAIVGGGSAAAYNVFQADARQAVSLPTLQGRVAAAMRVGMLLPLALGGLIGGLLASLIGTAGALSAAGFLELAVAALVAVGSKRCLLASAEPRKRFEPMVDESSDWKPPVAPHAQS